MKPPMTNKYCLEALDRTLKDILDYYAPFGGKVIIMDGDFCQVLPVIQKGSKTQMISACIIRCYLWANTKALHLIQNMRSMNDPEFAQFLMRIGGGVEPTKPNDMVKIPPQIALPWEGEQSIQTLIDHIFPQLDLHGWDASYSVERAIITPTNDDIQKLNDIIINLSGDEHSLLSFDRLKGILITYINMNS